MITDELLGKYMGLAVIDAQRKFCNDRPDWDAKADSVVLRINRLMAMFREAGRPIVAVKFEGETPCRKYEGTDGDDYFKGLAIEPCDVVVNKRHMNSFRETDLESVLKKLGYDMVLLCGTVSQYCVMSTYFAAIDREIVPYIAHGATISLEDRVTDASETVCKTLLEDTVARHLGVGVPEEGTAPVWTDSTYPDWDERLLFVIAALANSGGGHFMIGYPKGLKDPEGMAGMIRELTRKELGMEVSAEPTVFCSQDSVEVKVAGSDKPVIYHANKYVSVPTYRPRSHPPGPRGFLSFGGFRFRGPVFRHGNIFNPSLPLTMVDRPSIR